MTEQAQPNVALGSLGPLVSAVDIDGWVLEALNYWLPTYLALYEDAHQIQRGTYARPQSGHILTAITDAEFTDRQLPAIVVTALSNAGEPTRNPDWSYAATARVNISSVVRGRTPAETRQTAAVYEACCRQLLSQKGVPGVARQRWRGWTVIPLPDTESQGRYLAAGVTIFDFQIDQMAQAGFAGPTVPIDPGMQQQYVPSATADTVTIVVDGASPTGDYHAPPWARAVAPDTASASDGSALTVTLTGAFAKGEPYQVALPDGQGGYLWSDSSNLFTADGITLQAEWAAPSGVVPGAGSVAVFDPGLGVVPGEAMFTWTA